MTLQDFALVGPDDKAGLALALQRLFTARGHAGTRSIPRALEPSPIHIRAIDHVVLRVRDPGRMVGFYTRLLGCTVERRKDTIGLIQLRAGSSLIDLVDVRGQLGRAGGAPPGREGRNLDHLCLRIEPFDAQAIRDFLRVNGTQAGEVATRYGAEGDGPSLYIQDPEGNTIELKGPPAADAAA